MAKKLKTYHELSVELDGIMARLQADDIDVDAALSYYEQASVLIKQLSDYLIASENKLTELKKLAGQ